MRQRNANAIYAGSFDPLTNGHLWMIMEGAKLFDHLMVVVADNATKKSTFSTSDRVDLIKRTLKPGIISEGISVVSAENGFMVSLARTMHCQFLLRGLRSAGDFEYERTLHLLNADIDEVCNEGAASRKTIQTVFLMPPRDLAEVSSSFVKSLVGIVGWEKVVAGYVPPAVLAALKVDMDARHTERGVQFPKNWAAPIKRVLHKDLKRISEHSPFRSHCEVCDEGVMMVNRDQESYALLRFDRCVICGQSYWYTDDRMCDQPLVPPLAEDHP